MSFVLTADSGDPAPGSVPSRCRVPHLPNMALAVQAFAAWQAAAMGLKVSVRDTVFEAIVRHPVQVRFRLCDLIRVGGGSR